MQLNNVITNIIYVILLISNVTIIIYFKQKLAQFRPVVAQMKLSESPEMAPVILAVTQVCHEIVLLIKTVDNPAIKHHFYLCVQTVST